MTRHGFRYAEGTCQGTCRWPKGGTVRRRTAPAARRCASGGNWRMPLRPDRPSLSQGLSTNARARTHGGAGGRLLLLRQAVLLDRLGGCGRSCFSSGGGWLKVGVAAVRSTHAGDGRPMPRGLCARCKAAAVAGWGGGLSKGDESARPCRPASGSGCARSFAGPGRCDTGKRDVAGGGYRVPRCYSVSCCIASTGVCAAADTATAMLVSLFARSQR